MPGHPGSATEDLRRDERLRRALAIETVGVLFFTLDGRMLDANASFERMSGYTAAELREAVHWRQLTAPEFLERTARAADDVVARGETAPYEKQMIRKDGSRWWGLFAPKRIAGSGLTAECVEFIVDITDTKRAEAALRESDERQRMALDAAALGTWRHDIAAGILELDARARRHYGVDSGAPTLDAVVARIHPEDRPGLLHAMQAALDPAIKAPVRADYRVMAEDGGVRWLAVNGQVHFEGDGAAARPTIGVGTTRDITPQRAADAALREAERRKDEFLAMLAHELRNPLAPIRAAVGILRQPDVPGAIAARARDIIERQVAHMTRLVDDLLDVSRLSRGQITLQQTPQRLDEVLDAAVETARPAIEQHGHRFEQRRGARPVCVHGDLARLSQVFANLLNNAARYTPAGGAIAIDVAAGDGVVEVAVTDTGQGIAPDRLEQIFDLFAQGSGSPGPTVGGLGIGLALARRLIELHGGTLRASSPGEGLGSRFTATLPTIAFETAVASGGDALHAARQVLARRVLVVDDSVDAADMVATLLESAGCVVRAAHSGEQAVAAFPEFRPEIVLMDLGMPGMSGLEACRRIRALPAGDGVFVAALTGWGQDEDRRRTRDAGFDAHVVKPVATDALLELVEQAR